MSILKRKIVATRKADFIHSCVNDPYPIHNMHQGKYNSSEGPKIFPSLKYCICYAFSQVHFSRFIKEDKPELCMYKLSS